MTEPMHIVFAPDKKYAVHTGVAMASVIMRSRRPQALRFHILFAPGSREEKFWAQTRRSYEHIATRHGAKVDWVEVQDEQLSGLRGGWSTHLTPATFARLLIPGLLPQLERCLYLDGDLVALDDMAKLWAEDVSPAAFGAPPIQGSAYGADIVNFPSVRQFFCAGVLLMDLQKFRARGYGQKCLQLARETKWRGGCADQDVLHAVCADDYKLLDERWNIQTGVPPSAAPGIAHFTGRNKPWHLCFGNPYAAEYWRVRWQTPWRWLSAQELRSLSARLLSNLVRIHLQPCKGRYRLSVLGRRLIDVVPASAADGGANQRGTNQHEKII